MAMLTVAQNLDLAQAFQQVLADYTSYLREAMVYMDACAGQAVQTTLTMQMLQGMGVNCVFSLENASPQHSSIFEMLNNHKPTKLTVLLCQPLTLAHKALIHLLQIHTSLTHITILCSFSEEAHSALIDCPLGDDAFLEYETALRQDFEESQSLEGPKRICPTISVLYIPLHASALTSSVFFLTPITSRRYPLGTRAMAESPQTQETASEGSSKDKTQILAHALVGMAAHLGLRLENWSLGPNSAELCEKMSVLLPPETPSQRKASQSAACICIDREEDLISATEHSSHILAQVLEVHSKSEENFEASVDDKKSRAGNLNSLFKALLPVDSTQPWIQMLLERPENDALSYLRKWLREACRKENLSLPPANSVPGNKVTASQLEALLKVLRSSFRASRKNNQLIAITEFALTALKEQNLHKWTALAKQEAIFSMLAQEGAENVVSELEDLIRGSSQGLLNLDDTILLTLYATLALCKASSTPYGVSSVSVYTQDQLQRLKSALYNALDKSPESIARDVDGTINSANARLGPQALADQILDKLEKISQAELQRASQRFSGAQNAYSDVSKPLLGEFINQLFIGKASPFLRHHSASLRNYFNTGLGKFGLAKHKQASPLDHQTILVFVLGGLSIVDLRSVIEIQSKLSFSSESPKILLGGTKILNPSDRLQDLLAQR